ncbi:hypothetical protein HK104_004105, partial [Borealophlyctis nickersoniae]
NIYTYTSPKPDIITAKVFVRQTKYDPSKRSIQRESQQQSLPSVTETAAVPEPSDTSSANTPVKPPHTKVDTPSATAPATAPAPAPAPAPASKPASPKKPVTKPLRLYHDETLTSFFRRLTFTPDGALLLTPSGLCRIAGSEAAAGGEKKGEGKGEGLGADVKHTAYVFSRGNLRGAPIAHLPNHKKASIAIRCNPKPYKLRSTSTSPAASSDENQCGLESSAKKSMIKLPYRWIYAVATQDSVMIYDTDSPYPIGMLNNLHYATFTDLSWSPDGSTLILASVDGFCSLAVFEEGELGVPFLEAEMEEIVRARQGMSRGGVAEVQGQSTNKGGESVLPNPASVPASPAPLCTPTVSAPSSPMVVPAVSTPLVEATGQPIAVGSKREGKLEDDKPPVKKRRIAPTLIGPVGQ